jgi:hypothetical protein
MNQQSLSERIDTQIAQLNQMKDQIKSNHQQPAINQTFQLAPSNASMRYANTIDEVGKETIYSDTPFFSKDMSVLWVKDLKGNIRTYELNEIVPKDEKDIKIEFLMAQIEELKKGMKANESKSNVDEPASNTDESEEPSNVSNVSKSTKKSK